MEETGGGSLLQWPWTASQRLFPVPANRRADLTSFQVCSTLRMQRL
jgi:hypothetical protein